MVRLRFFNITVVQKWDTFRVLNFYLSSTQWYSPVMLGSTSALSAQPLDHSEHPLRVPRAPGIPRLSESTLGERAGWLFRPVGGRGGRRGEIPHLGLEGRPEMAALPPAGWGGGGDSRRPVGGNCGDLSELKVCFHTSCKVQNDFTLLVSFLV